MALIKTTDELKACFSSIDKDYQFNSIRSFVDDAELDLIIPEIGQEAYDLVATAYHEENQPNLTGHVKQLHLLLQKAVTHLALFLSADSGSFRISDSGFFVSKDANTAPVSDKKMVMFKNGRKESGYKAIDQAIAYLEKHVNEEVFAPYKNSDTHKRAQAYFITNPITFTHYFRNLQNSGVTFRAMLSAMDQAEREYILPVLGNSFYNGLKERQLAGTLTGAELKLLPYIQRPLAYYTVGESIPVLPIEFDGTNKYITSLPSISNGENVEDKASVAGTRLSGLMNTCIMTGNKELTRLKDYLVKHANDLDGYVLPEQSDWVDNPNDKDRGTYMV